MLPPPEDGERPLHRVVLHLGAGLAALLGQPQVFEDELLEKLTGCGQILSVSRPPESVGSGAVGRGSGSGAAPGDAPKPRVVPGRRASAAALARVSGSAHLLPLLEAKLKAARLTGCGLALSRRGSASAASLLQLAEADASAAAPPSPVAETLSAKERWQLAVRT